MNASFFLEFFKRLLKSKKRLRGGREPKLPASIEPLTECRMSGCAVKQEKYMNSAPHTFVCPSKSSESDRGWVPTFVGCIARCGALVQGYLRALIHLFDK
jgi:hypothetical protein